MEKFQLFHCYVYNFEMKELINLLEQTPILPNIASISWYDDGDYSEEGDDWDGDLHDKLIKTFRCTFPHSELRSYKLLE
jgi:hypothetical protein